MQTSRKTLQLIFVWGLFLGVICHLCVYGPRVLDVCNDGWIMKANDQDIRQHYIGFLMYRNSALGFPLGITKSLSFPAPMSIVYTDSIPLFALIFRLLSPILPDTFQYFGWFGLISFALMGGFSARVLYRLTKNVSLSAILPVFFILSFPMLQRNFYHTSLTAQWIILLCVELWLSGICEKKIRVQCGCWAIVGFLIASIHIYFLPMALCILAGMLLCEMLKKNHAKEAISSAAIPLSSSAPVAAFLGSVVPIVSLLGSAAITLWIFGAFEGKAAASYDVGIFGMNLNSLINSMGNGLILKGLPTATDFQFEGAIYAGFGGIVLLVAAIIALAVKSRTGVGESELKTGRKNIAGEVWGKLSPKEHPFRFSVAVVCLVFLIASVSPLFSFGSKIIVQIPYPKIIGKVAGIFRSNGRFAWPILYFIYLIGAWAVSSIACRSKKWIVPVICLLTVVIQLVDLSPMICEKHERFSKYYKPYVTDWDVEELPDTYKHFVTYEDDVTFMTELGYYASKHDMTLNRFYFARNIDETIAEYEAAITQNLLGGQAEADTIYILDLEHYELLKETGLHFYASEKCVFATKDSVPNKEEMTEETFDEIRWPKK